ncbi:MAG: (Na+)-NQR maturation NqrM [Porticoccaceae bacterium]
MLDILFAVLGFMFLVSIMAIGVLLGKKPISGSCGGVAAALGEKDYTCEICGDDPNKCDEISNASKAMYTNADKFTNKE